MVYSYTPTYYSTLHDSITSLCKTILPFSFKNRRLPAAEHKLAKLQSDNLKWQQDSYHQMLNLMGLHREGILAQHEVSAFRSHLLNTLDASPSEQEQPVILRDKLLFLQELLYAKCISEDEYHTSKRPLLQRLAVQGAEIEGTDVIVSATAKEVKEDSDEEWSVIDLKDEQNKEKPNSNKSKSKKHGSATKQIKGAASVLSFVTPNNNKPKRSKEERAVYNENSDPKFPSKNELSFSRENPFWDVHLKEKECKTPSILMPGSSPLQPAHLVKESGGDATMKVKKKPFRILFQREGHGGCPESEERVTKSAKKQWGFDGFKKWKRSESEDETTLPFKERSNSEAFAEIDSGHLVASPMGEGPDTKQIKRKLHSDGSSSDFFIDKVLGDRIKKELSRIQAELCTTNTSLQLSDDQIEAISNKLPVYKTDLKKFFPETWCDLYGDVVVDVVKKEFKEHVGEMENLRNAVRERRNSSRRWTMFEDDENCHPNLFAKRRGSNGSDNVQDHNPFWIPGHGSSS